MTYVIPVTSYRHRSQWCKQTTIWTISTCGDSLSLA